MVEQGTDEWRAQRVGKVTCSRIIDIMPGAKGYRAARKNYVAELAIERLTGEPQDNGFTSKAMEWGIEQEPFARSEYEAVNGVMIEEAGFIDHPEIEGFGGSPDGLIGDDGGIEIKCPNTATHIETLKDGKVKMDYFYQMVGLMMVTGREWWDFFSYDPRLPDNLCRYQRRFELDEGMKTKVEQEVLSFLSELKELVNELESYRGGE